MAWVTLYVILALFVAAFIAFIAAVFWVQTDWLTRSLLGGIDGLLIWPLRRVVGHLFPERR